MELLLLLMVGLARTFALKCYDCEGRHCVADTCEGDYCVVTAFTPMWANTEFRPRKIIKGCVKGSLLKKDIPTACETVPDKEQYITNCFCSSEDFCNKNMEIHPKNELKLVKCACDGRECNGRRSRTCMGEYCTILRQGSEEEELRGCVNTTTSLIERRGDGAVIQPPLTGGVHQAGQDMKSLLETESYMCSSDWCNNEWPRKLQRKRLHCPTFYAVHLQGFPDEDKRGAGCQGEYCWNVTIKAEGEGLFRGYRAGGCMTLLEGSEISEEFNQEGCLEFNSEKFSINACFHTEGQRLPEPETAEEAKEEVEELRKEGKHVAKVLEEEAEGKKPITPHKDHKPKSMNARLSPQAPAKLAEIEDEAERALEEEEVENNNTIIGVFVALMVLIVIAGIVWKTQIHRRLFRARYETVAG